MTQTAPRHSPMSAHPSAQSVVVASVPPLPGVPALPPELEPPLGLPPVDFPAVVSVPALADLPPELLEPPALA
jgi:hypothetical protein